MKVSIIIPTYNRGYCIARSIDSILAQTYQDYELIIMDDGSTDQTEALVAEYMKRYPNIHYLKLPQNKGVANARNIGMKEARGDYIAFQDSDDYWHIDKLEKQMKAMEDVDADYSYTYIRYKVGEEDEFVVPNPEYPLDQMNDNIFPQMLRGNYIGAPTLIMKRACYEQIGDFDVTLPALEDYDYGLRLSKTFKAAFVNECLFEATQTEKGITNNANNYLIASCMLIARYKKSLIEYDEFNYRVDKLLRQAKSVGVEEQIIKLLEHMLTLG